MPGSWGHLTRRFLWSLGARALTDVERDEVAAVIAGPLLAAFDRQSAADQRHGLDSARYVARRGGRPDLVEAALVHDIGKRHARLGVIGRVTASVLVRLGLPAPGRLGEYLDHPRLGAEELEALGVSRLAVDFTAHHHGSRPDTITPEDWSLLLAADAVTDQSGADN